jgi:homocitrate synthase
LAPAIPYDVIVTLKILSQIKDATAKIKELADVRTQSMDDVDSLLRVYHAGIQSGELEVGQKEALDRLLVAHREEQRQVTGIAA